MATSQVRSPRHGLPGAGEKTAPFWDSEVHAVAGGWLVLAGLGMYINQAMAAGIDYELSSVDLDVVLERSTVDGVAPTIEVTSITLP